MDKDKLEDSGFSERVDGETPYGGAYSIAYFYDEEHKPCRKSDAVYVHIHIYNDKDERINEVYGDVRNSRMK